MGRRGDNDTYFLEQDYISELVGRLPFPGLIRIPGVDQSGVATAVLLVDLAGLTFFLPENYSSE